MAGLRVGDIITQLNGTAVKNGCSQQDWLANPDKLYARRLGKRGRSDRRKNKSSSYCHASPPSVRNLVTHCNGRQLRHILVTTESRYFDKGNNYEEVTSSDVGRLAASRDSLVFASIRVKTWLVSFRRRERRVFASLFGLVRHVVPAAAFSCKCGNEHCLRCRFTLGSIARISVP